MKSNKIKDVCVKLCTDLLNDERGQSTTEYIMILAVVVMVASKFKSVFQQKLIDITTNLGTQIGQGVTNDATQ